MPAPRVYRTEALVLRGMDLGEADRLLTLFTPRLGKLRALARGVRRPKSKLGGHLDVLCHSDLMLARGRNLDTITGAQARHGFPALRGDLLALGQALYVLELVDLFTAEGMENYSLFQLTLTTLERLPDAGGGETPLRYFELRLLEATGYRPQLYNCHVCRRPLEPQDNYFSPSGGVICPSCQAQEPFSHPLSLGVLKVLRHYLRAGYEEARGVRLTPSQARELKLVLGECLRYHGERDSRAGAFLERVKGLPSQG
ncbi:MAG: DNA repair protein RecO [Chloroflexi bacterium]|nr:DNA repair protein RecO [Chloroflexota bacterium]